MKIHPLLSERTAGVLLHPTSLPSRQGAFGIGDLGPTARGFVEWMQSAGLSRWQMLPVGPVGAVGTQSHLQDARDTSYLSYL